MSVFELGNAEFDKMADDNMENFKYSSVEREKGSRRKRRRRRLV